MITSSLAATLVSIAAIQFLGWATPGPNHLAIVTASVSGGRRAGLASAMGIAAGALTWALLAVSGIAVLFELFPKLFVSIRLVGAAYLIFLGAKAFQSIKSGGMLKIPEDGTVSAPKAPFMTAYMVMMTNPKAVLFFASILTAFIPKDGSVWVMFIIVMEIGLIGAILNIFAALFFSNPAVVRGFHAAGPVVSIAFGLLFCGLGLAVAVDTLSGLTNP